MTESFAQLFEQSIANQRIRPGMILTGLVVDVGDDMVIVNVGLKSEAVIPLEQFKNERGEIEVKAGDSIEVALDAMEAAPAKTGSRAKKPSVPAPGPASKNHSTNLKSSPAPSRAV